MKMIWSGYKIKENYLVLVNQFQGNFHSKTPSCRKIKSVFGDVKWWFNASWGLKGLIVHGSVARCARPESIFTRLWLDLSAWKVGDRGFPPPRSGIQILKMFSVWRAVLSHSSNHPQEVPHDQVWPVCAQRWPKTPYISFHLSHGLLLPRHRMVHF